MNYRYNAKVLDVYDGDTMTLLIDVGFNIHLKEKVRLTGIDTPEIRTSSTREKIHGIHVRDYLREMLLGNIVEIETTKEGKFGRYLVDVFYEDLHINQHLIDRGDAKPYDGGKREKWYQ